MNKILAACALLLCVLSPRPCLAQDAKTSSPHGTLAIDVDCSACHTADGWRPAKKKMDFDHGQTTSFALTGSHTGATCTSCHLAGRFDQPKLSGQSCTNCHVDVHQGNLSKNCLECHNTISFTEVTGVAVHAQTRFPLTGSHLQISCESCHIDDRGGAFTARNTECFSCHEREYNSAATVDHVGSRFPTSCQDCHNTLGWGGTTLDSLLAGAPFDHAILSGGFALRGAHTIIQCESCHVIPGYELRFATTNQNDCITCHQSDHEGTHGDGFPTDCLSCHTHDRWPGAAFEHFNVSNGFDLVGAHATAPCASCHQIPGYAPLFATSDANDCFSCHQVDYDRTHGDPFPTDCATCHRDEGWTGPDFDHFTTSDGFELRGLHAVAPCESCHAIPGYDPLFATNDVNDCVTCHQSDHEQNHGGAFPTDCTTCHTEDGWPGAVVDHVVVSGGFELVGAHATAPCSGCHVVPGYEPLFATTDRNDCIACHQADFDSEHGAGFRTDCTTCHTNDTWLGAEFDHVTASNGFDLVGAHAVAPCSSCHVVPGYEPLFATTDRNDCIACHQADFDTNHGTGFSTECTSCHMNDTWLGADFNHLAASGGFDLVGAHDAAPCTSCHVIPGYTSTFTPSSQNDCIACHQPDFDANHGAGFRTDCPSCHGNATWTGAAYDHLSASGYFDLVGAHVTVACTSCHVVPGYAPIHTPTSQNDCVACHRRDYDFIHGGAFPTDCTTCHNNDTWLGATIDHPAISGGFDLVGAHAGAACISCHEFPGYTLIYTPVNQNDCVACHQFDFDAQHGAGFRSDCVTCHTTDTWLGATFDHLTASGGFDLVGGHATAPCIGCHVIPGYAPIYTPAGQNDCIACHQTDYDSQHGGTFPTDCTSCHSANSWLDITFDHVAASSGFDLIGAHATAPCAGCHVIPGYAPLYTPTGQNDCVACHQTEFDNNHGAGFRTDCVTCHSSDTWLGATFDHLTASNGFDLVGVHATAPCTSCHVVPGYASIYTPAGQNDCFACHQADHDGHHGGTFPTDCSSCHTTDTWLGATIDHIAVSSGFDLVGAHEAAPCASCHLIPGYTPIYTPANQNDCIACHQSQFDGQHGAGFRTDCVTCHTTDTWLGATFDHLATSNGFELVGAHATAPCASCHLIPGYAPIYAPTDQNDCIACHQSQFDAQHGTGFRTDCATCHTTDTWLGAAFDHLTASGSFDLVGAHVAAPCASCHVIPGYAPIYAPTSQNDCIACHQSTYDAAHVGSGVPTTCLTCHTIDTWLGAVFEHDREHFPIYSGKHSGKWNNDCTKCHVVPSDFTVFTCFNCHKHDQVKTDEKHRGESGYVYDSNACYSCHPRGSA